MQLLFCPGIQGSDCLAGQEVLGSRGSQHLRRGRAQPLRFGKLGHFIPPSQNWAEGEVHEAA